MLTTFPYLLSFAAFAPFFIRIAVALFLYIAARHLYQNRARATAEVLPRLRAAWPGIYILLGVEIIAGLSLLLGLYTQIGAILGIIVFLKLTLSVRYFPSISPWTRALPLLLGLLCITLLMTGAGIFAFDYPF